MTGIDSGALVGQIIIYLVDENILPYHDESRIYIPDTIYNRQIIFNLFQSFIDRVMCKDFVSFKSEIIIIDCSKIEELSDNDKNGDLTINIVNCNKIADLETDQPFELLIESKLKDLPEAPVSCFILNKKCKVLSQNKNLNKCYFDRDPLYAICFCRGMAHRLINNYKNCFIVEVQRKSKDSEYLKALRFLMKPVNYNH